MAMKQIEYKGFGSSVCVCHYLSVPAQVLPGGSPGLILTQGKPSSTSITNCVEDIVNSLLLTDYIRVSPKTLRFFEHHKKSSASLFEWQEVTFTKVTECFLKDDFMSKTKRNWLGSEPDYWCVDEPRWTPIGTSLAKQLDTLVCE